MADDDSKKAEDIEIVEESSNPHETPDVSETEVTEADTQAEELPAPVQKIEVKDPGKRPFKDRLKAFWHTKKGKVITIILAVVVVVAVLLAIPFTRYAIVGVAIKKDVTFTILDQDSKRPVSGATLRIGTQSVTTDAEGKAVARGVSVGEYRVNLEKKYYLPASFAYTVPILSAPQDTQPTLKATGREVEITVKNSISGTGVQGATVTISESSVTTDDKGVAHIILPVKDEKQAGKVAVDGYNEASFEVEVKNTDDQKVVAKVTPKGEIYFLSKRTGKIDVMKSNLDGSNPKVVVKGTGQENEYGTVLLSTTDWKYLALLASRDSEKAKIYLIETSTGKMSEIDAGNATFELVGWSGHRFVYHVYRQTAHYWDNKREALKSFDAESGKLTVLDETQGIGSSDYNNRYETIGNIYIVDDTVVYAKAWDKAPYVSFGDRKSAIMNVNTDGSNKKRLKEFSLNNFTFFEARLYEPKEVYFRVASDGGKSTFYEYEDGKLAETSDTNDQKFINDDYPTYLISPSGKKTLWYDSRDGKNVIFVGDENGNNAREIGVSDYRPYGWFTDDYLLFSKDNSELYILAQDGKITSDSQPLKVTDYHKPRIQYPGYGSGYGGQ